MFKSENRLRDERVIRALFGKGERISSPYFLCKYFIQKPRTDLAEAKEDLVPRFAVIVSKKIAKKAVKRNLLRRRLQEALRLHISAAPPVSATFFVSASVREALFTDLEKEVERVFGRMKKE